MQLVLIKQHFVHIKIHFLSFWVLFFLLFWLFLLKKKSKVHVNKGVCTYNSMPESVIIMSELTQACLELWCFAFTHF